MNNEQKKYTVSIYGAEYTLMSDESQEHVQHAAQSVDAMMNQIGSRLKSGSLDRVAVLSALCLASELLHYKKSAHQREQQLNQVDERLEKMLERIHSVL